MRKMNDVQSKGQEQTDITDQYKDLLSNLTKENQEMKMRIEDGNSDQSLLRNDLVSIEEN